MEPKNFKRQTWIGGIIIAASIAAFSIAAVLFANDIGAQASAITQARTQAATQSAMINAYSTLKADSATAGSYQAAMDKLLSTQDNLIGFPSQIDNIAHNDGVDLTFSFEGNPTPSGPNAPGYMGFTMNAIGGMSNIILFLRDMEASAPIMISKIDSFDLTQSGANYTLSATGKVFFRS